VVREVDISRNLLERFVVLHTAVFRHYETNELRILKIYVMANILKICNWVRFLAGAMMEFLLFATASRLALGPTEPSIQGVQDGGLSGRGVKQITLYLHSPQYEGVTKSFRTESITKYTHTFGTTH
jgi:hypothetical protein